MEKDPDAATAVQTKIPKTSIAAGGGSVVANAEPNEKQSATAPTGKSDDETSETDSPATERDLTITVTENESVAIQPPQSPSQAVSAELVEAVAQAGSSNVEHSLAVLSRTEQNPVNDAPVRALALASVAAAVDPYVQMFKDLDPTDQFYTPASPNWWVYDPNNPNNPPVITFDETVELLGTAGFSRDSGGSLRFTNSITHDVGIIWKRSLDPASRIDGFIVVRPGATVTIPGGPSVYAVAQAPKIYAPPNLTSTYLSVGGPGHPSVAASPPPRTALQVAFDTVGQTLGRILDYAAQRVRDAVQFVRDVATFVETSVRNTFYTVTNAVNAAISEADWNSKKSAPGNIAELHDRLRDWAEKAPNSMYIERVQDQRVDGAERYIVYIGGTVPANLWGDNQSLVTNLPAYDGKVKEHQIQAINNAIGDRNGVEILIVGFSQGGLDAQNLAENENRLHGNVVGIVTSGTPIIVNPSNNYGSIHLGAYKDPVAAESKSGPLQANISALRTWAYTPTTYQKYSSQWWNPIREIQYHGERDTYNQVTREFTKSQDSRYKGIKDLVGTFRGKVMSTWSS